MTVCTALHACASVLHQNLHLCPKDLRIGKKLLVNMDISINIYRSSECHKISDEKAASFLQTQLPGTDIMARINKHISEQQIQTKKGILAIIDVILALGQRGIALRGNWDKKEAC